MVMSYVLNENSKNATIHTCDLISNITKQYNNCYLSKGKISRGSFGGWLVMG